MKSVSTHFTFGIGLKSVRTAPPQIFYIFYTESDLIHFRSSAISIYEYNIRSNRPIYI